ncbi:MAG: SymE family type I addiction module toxin [Reichenbachiella sp.]|uniref:SymE family type I addiction module toxin n=1 Tax=Reichenbachiella sp. TaxID=2184521 RepID=UPI0032656FF7
MNNKRKLKIHSKYRARTWDSVIVPEIRLEGKWLKDLGFEEGCNVEIKQERHKLTISLIEKK